ncbi:hypothetical protein AB7179_17205 [Providencia manganoxydans]|uniref:hypothetical protein n=1 Tax=Providencia TaxID=586 RepID=UPI001586B0FA|nr:MULTISPECIES: hypothetical protein [Providencia]MDX4946912.1 hypothetical protein [Providencia manganoxydans]HEF8771838.1 hypothetical protein [Providencia stuartii]
MKHLLLAISMLFSSAFATYAAADDIDVCIQAVVDPITGAVICLDIDLPDLPVLPGLPL